MIKIEKVAVNIGAGGVAEKVEKGKKLLLKLTAQKPVLTKATKRIPSWNIKKGLVVGVKVTMRGKKAREFLEKCLDAVDRKINERNFDNTGNFAFGIREYIDIPEAKYDPSIGILGFDVCVSLKKIGYRVSKRRKSSHIPKKQFVTKEEAIDFVRGELKTEVIS